MNHKYLIPILLTFVYGSYLNAQTFVDANAIGKGDGTSWLDAYTSLDSALRNTNAGDIWVAAGTYRHDGSAPDSFRTFLVQTPINLYGSFAGNETSPQERNIDSNPTILSADFNGDDISGNFDTLREDNSFHVMTIDSFIQSPVIIDGFIISGGNTNNDVELDQYTRRGGGIYAWSSIEVNQCTFMDNYANAGAGVFLDPTKGGDNGSKLTNNKFTKNLATSRGAGTYFYNQSNILIDGNTFTDNLTARGCIYPFRSDQIMISNNIFDNNKGVFNDVFCTGVFDFRSTNVTITDCEFKNSIAANATAIYFDGDSILAENKDNLVILNCLFENNTATGYGGNGLYMWQGVGIRIENCTFLNNIAPNAAAIYLDGRSQVIDANNVIIKDCLFQGNQATAFGGGAMYSFQGSSTFENCLFEGNSAPNGASLFLGGDRGKQIHIRECEFLENEASAFGQMILYGENSFFEVTRSIFRGNTVGEGGGAIANGFMANVLIDSCDFADNVADRGAVFIQNDSTFVTISNSFFSGNVAQTSGGALCQLNGSNVTVNNSDFVSNMAEDGGALSSMENAADILQGALFINNSKFHSNSANGRGGAINITDTDAVLTNTQVNNNLGGISGGGIFANSSEVNDTVNIKLVNCTIAENEGAVGAGIGLFTGELDSSLILILQNTILANEGRNFEIGAGNPSVVSLGGNLLSDSSLNFVLDTQLQDKVGAEQQIFINSDEEDFHLAAGSPAINIGQLPAPEFDIEGNPRVNAPDAGSYEYQLDVNVNEQTTNNHGQLVVAPNPVKDVITINLNNEWSGSVNAHLFTINGQLVRTWHFNKQNTKVQLTIDASDLTKGIYELHMCSGTEIMLASLVKL